MYLALEIMQQHFGTFLNIYFQITYEILRPYHKNINGAWRQSILNKSYMATSFSIELLNSSIPKVNKL